MARKDLRKQITIFPPNGGPGEKHSLLNARDLITHSGWTTTPQHADQFKPVDEILKESKIELTDEEKERQAILNKPIDQMTLAELHIFAEEEFGTKIDKRLNLNKAIDRLKEIADMSNYKLKFSDSENQEDDNEDDNDLNESGYEDRTEDDSSDE